MTTPVASRHELAREVLDDDERRNLAAWERATTVNHHRRHDGFLRVDENGVDRDGVWYPGTEAE